MRETCIPVSSSAWKTGKKENEQETGVDAVFSAAAPYYFPPLPRSVCSVCIQIPTLLLFQSITEGGEKRE
jgi:hypothetical protein